MCEARATSFGKHTYNIAQSPRLGGRSVPQGASIDSHMRSERPRDEGWER